MRKFVRGEEPGLLKDKGAQWTGAWVARRQEKPAAKFQWPEHDGVKLNHHLLPALKLQTQNHCSFCDGFPVEDVSHETIEHFRSKTRHPEEAYAWTNLYYACTACQGGKQDTDSDELLRPDDPAYEFPDYFYWDVESGILLVNPRSSAIHQLRAKATCRLYGLNDHNRPIYRKEQRRWWLKLRGEDEDLHRWPYRDYISNEA